MHATVHGQSYNNMLGHIERMKYVRYQSEGNTVGIEDGADDFWEIADDGYVSRSINLQSDGSRLKYDRQHEADKFGALPEGVITDEMLADRAVGKITFLTAAQFAAEWTIRGKNEAVA